MLETRALLASNFAAPIAAKATALASAVRAAQTAVVPTVSVSDVAVTEGARGRTSTATVAVTLSQAVPRAVRITFRTEAETATGSGSARDFLPARGVLTIRRGATTGQIRVRIRGDNTAEADEAFNVVLTRAVNATLQPGSSGRQSASVVILDDDTTSTPTTPALIVTGFSATEGNSGTTTANFTVTLSAASTSTVTVAYATVDGSATAGSDYQAASGTLTFAPGETSKTVPITIIGDTTVEANETLTLNLSNPTGATLSAAAAVGTIVGDDGGTQVTLTPAVTQGPYFEDFTDASLNRSDITTGTTRSSVLNGVPLTLTFNVYQVSGNVVSPLSGARVDVWHADAIGTYSDQSSEGTAGQTFLRGDQSTDANGSVTFKTIFPGWYRGRTPHIHFMVRTGTTSGTLTNRVTSQLFFDESLINTIFANAPYNSRGTRDTTNAADMVYNTTTTSGTIAGPSLLVTLTPTGTGGYTATFNVYVQAS
jgi:protocatechuate 3,4-dioxygenase beta subunit